MRRTIVVGDVHGCVDELRDLLQRCDHGRDDRLVMAGDLVAKGPDSQGVIQLLREHKGESVLGNHDAHVLRLRDPERMGKPPKREHQQVLDTLTAPDWAYLEALPVFIRLGREPGEASDTVVVHAGVVPGVPIDEQDREHLTTLRSIRPNGDPTKKLVDRPWASVWRGPERIVFGHDALRGLQQQPFATGLDTGCVYGLQLTALILPERRIVQVRARRAYAEL